MVIDLEAMRGRLAAAYQAQATAVIAETMALWTPAAGSRLTLRLELEPDDYRRLTAPTPAPEPAPNPSESV